MVRIDLADGLYRPFVQRFELGIQFVHGLKVGGYRLIDEFIAQDDRLVLVTLGNTLPDVAEELLALLALEKPGVAVAVVDVIARLSARRIMHVEDEVEMVVAAPVHDAVDAGKAVLLRAQTHVIFVREELVVEGQTDGVGSRRGDKLDVPARDIVVLEGFPKLGRKVGSRQLAEHLVNHPRGIGARETEHVPLGIEPVPEVCPPDQEFRPVGLNQIRALHPHEGFRPVGRFAWPLLRSRLLASAEKKGCQQED